MIAALWNAAGEVILSGSTIIVIILLSTALSRLGEEGE